MPHDTITRDQVIRKAQNETHKRSFVIERELTTENEDGTVNLAFASDTPCEHFSYKLWDFIDVKLSIKPESIRTERLQNGMAVIMGHDESDWRAHIAAVQTFSIDEKDRMVRARVKFSDSPDGVQIKRDMLNGIRPNVSVAFSIHKLVLEQENEDGNDLYRADDWEPFHIGIVPTPADTKVGYNRSLAQVLEPETRAISNNEETKMPKTAEEIAAEQAAEEAKRTAAQAVDGETHTRKAADAKKVDDINNHIEFGKTFGFENEVREASLKNPEFTMADARMLVQQLRDKQKRLDERVSPPKQIDTEANTLGNALITSDEYRGIKPGTNQEYKIRVQTNILPSQLARAAYTGSGDGLTGYDRVPGIVELGQQQPTVADLFMQAQTDSPTIRYMKETSYTQYADTVLEGDDKPEATFVLEETDVSVRKVAVFTKVTDETLEDFSQIRPYIDTRLSFMVRSKIDNQLLNGSGTAPNLAGLLGTSGVQTAEMASNTALEFAKACMNAITKVRTVGFFDPDAIVMHPNDYEKLRLAVDGNSQFYGGGFFQGQYGTGYNDPNFLWGVRVVQTTAIDELNLATPGASNKGPIVGAFKMGGAVFYRNGLSVESTNTDQDDFIMNLTTIRVEQRLALAIYRPLAFCRVINAS